MTVYVSSTTTWWNVEESGVNGRYYWKDSSLADRYCNWYSCDWFNGYFLLRFIFRIGLIPIVIGCAGLSIWKSKNSTGPYPSTESDKEGRVLLSSYSSGGTLFDPFHNIKEVGNSSSQHIIFVEITKQILCSDVSNIPSLCFWWCFSF